MPIELIFKVTFELEVTASNPKQAAGFALDDLRDRRLAGDWAATVEDEDGVKSTVLC